METVIRGLFAGVFVFAGVVLIGLQIFWFLQSGSWTPISLIDLAQRFSQEPWLYNPTEWLGVHWILSVIPSSAAAIVIGFIIVSVE